MKKLFYSFTFGKQSPFAVKGFFVLLLISTLSYGQQLFDSTQLNCKGLSANSISSILAPNCSASSPAYLTKYGKQSTYIPSVNDPVITLKITFHVINKLNGTGSWPGTPQGVNDLTQLGNYMNNWTERFSNPRSASYSVPGFVSPPINWIFHTT